MEHGYTIDKVFIYNNSSLRVTTDTIILTGSLEEVTIVIKQEFSKWNNKDFTPFFIRYRKYDRLSRSSRMA